MEIEPVAHEIHEMEDKGEENEEMLLALLPIIILAADESDSDDDDNQLDEEEEEEEEMEEEEVHQLETITLVLSLLFTVIEDEESSNMLKLLFPDWIPLEIPGQDVFSHLASHPYQFWFLTGESVQSFLELVNLIAEDVRQPRNVRLLYDPHQLREARPCKLDIVNRILLVIIWYRQCPNLHMLAERFGVSPTTCDDEIHHVTPIIRYHLQQEIRWFNPQEMEQIKGTWPQFPTAIAALDCTIHRVNKPLEGQGEYYRGDKACHFMSTFAVCDPFGYFRLVESGFKGHLNDTMNYHLSRLGTGAAPLNPNTHILADGGFPNINPLIIPFNEATANANPALAVP